MLCQCSRTGYSVGSHIHNIQPGVTVFRNCYNNDSLGDTQYATRKSGKPSYFVDREYNTLQIGSNKTTLFH
jgi:hypothetical protein